MANAPVNPRGDAQVTVVGAGPYGLSVAAHLKARKVPLRIFGEPMDGWRSHMPHGMYLKSSPLVTSISAPRPGYRLGDFYASEGGSLGGERDPLPIADFVRYGLWFQQRCVPEVERATVRRIESVCGGGFRIALDSGEEFVSRAAVIAAGVPPFAHVPPVLSRMDGDGLISHTADHTDLSRFAGQRVVVLGAGQSALETAALLNEAAAKPTVVTRGTSLSFGPPPQTDRVEDRPLRHRLMWPGALLGTGWPLVACSRGPAAFRHLPPRTRAHLVRTVLGPSGAWWLRERVDGRVPVLCGRAVRSAARDGAGVRIELQASDGGLDVVQADHVIAGTGYRVDMDRLEFLSPELRRAVLTSAGGPQLSAGFESSVPGLYFAGLAAAASFGPLMRFVVGTGFTARRISAALAA